MAKRKSNKKKKQEKKQDISLIIVIILSVLLTVLIYTQSGTIGIALSDFFGGMIGILKYVLPIGAFAVAIKMACIDDDGYISSKIGQYVLLLIFIFHPFIYDINLVTWSKINAIKKIMIKIFFPLLSFI